VLPVEFTRTSAVAARAMRRDWLRSWRWPNCRAVPKPGEVPVAFLSGVAHGPPFAPAATGGHPVADGATHPRCPGLPWQMKAPQ
jgi:hypothetical protein